MALVRTTQTPELFEAAVEGAAELLRAQEAVVLPTETVYGLAANALDPVAVGKIFSIKGRPASNPIIVHVSSVTMATRCVSTWPEMADRLAEAFWPGPLTIVLPKSSVIPSIVTAGGLTVGIRWPAHPVIQAVIERCGFPLAAPSANLSGQVSPTTAEHVRRALGDKVALIVDGGAAEVGIESTVLDLSVSPPAILRPGMVHAESLAAVVGAVAAHVPGSGQVLRSPGLLLKHYSPQAKLVIWDKVRQPNFETELEAMRLARERVHVLSQASPVGLTWGQVCVMPRDAHAYAKALYSELHRCDQAGAALIVVESVPESAEWAGVADRLRRAAA